MKLRTPLILITLVIGHAQGIGIARRIGNLFPMFPRALNPPTTDASEIVDGLDRGVLMTGSNLDTLMEDLMSRLS